MGSYRNVVVLTGAGISAESGLATFRDGQGVWAKYDFRKVATPEAFAANPDLVHEFYNLRRSQLNKVEPNAAHKALVMLEQHLISDGGRFTLITQNVDDLHKRAGSKTILPMHGELLKVECTHCGHVHVWEGDLTRQSPCLACHGTGGMRPYIVWFGEMPRFIPEIEAVMEQADLFVSIGTSGSVYPAAGLVNIAQQIGADTLELNLEASENAHMFTEGVYGPATQIVPAWVEGVIGKDPL